MNREELKEFVEKDKDSVREDVIERTRKIFHDVLGVFPDMVFPDDKYEYGKKQDIESTYLGYKCRLDGIDFYAGTKHLHVLGCGYNFSTIYQVTTVTYYSKRTLRKSREITNISYREIKRPADIMV